MKRPGSRQRKASSSETTSADSQLQSRKILQQLYEASPLPRDDLIFNLGLYTRSSLLVKFIVMNQLYERILKVPGALMEFGVWWGQNLVLLENLRAIHEPFNKQRTIVGFDTFAGYTASSGNDVAGKAVFQDAYATGKAYKKHLQKLIEVHEGCNVLGHIRGAHRLIEGDVSETAPQYFADHPETIVAFACFDLALYDPTKAALQAVKPHLVSGSVLLLDELTWKESPGEAVAFKKTFARGEYDIEKCALYPGKAIVTIR